MFFFRAWDYLLIFSVFLQGNGRGAIVNTSTIRDHDNTNVLVQILLIYS